MVASPSHLKALVAAIEAELEPYAGSPDWPVLLDAGPSERGGHNYGMFMACPQLWAYHYLLELDDGGGEALTKGAMLHAALAHFYEGIRRKQLDVDEPLATPRQAAIFCANEFEDGWKWVDLVLQTLDEYVKYWATDGRRYRVLAVEQQFRAKFWVDDRWELITVRKDLVLEDRQGRVLVVDHKSRAWGSPKTLRGYANGLQTLLLERFGRRIYPNFHAVHLNLVTWPKETRNKYTPARFERELIPTRPAALAALPQTLAHVARQQRQLLASGLDPWDWPKYFGDNGSCETRWGPCPFTAICSQGKPLAFEEDAG